VSPQTTPIPGHPLLYAIDDLLGLHKNVEAILNPETGKSEALTAQDKQAIKLYEEGLQKILDLIAPSAMQVKRNELILGSTPCRDSVR
jgi:hypothetical protein